MPQTEFRQPAEWDLHDACWLAWPSHGDLWQENLAPAQEEFTALCRAITGVDFELKDRPVEPLHVLVPDRQSRAQAEKALRGLPVTFHDVGFGDIWLRDTAPIFVQDQKGHTASSSFLFNGWGGKYVLDHDAGVSAAIAKLAKFPSKHFPWVLEGGSVEVDGLGTCLTTRQCLLNPNRNPGMTEKEIETGLAEALGITKTLWLRDGLLNDHTDGHIDTIARFVRPGTVICMEPSGKDDPNTAVLNDIRNDLSKMTDARGKKLEVITVPSPGQVTNQDGDILAASYVNFYISNRTVVVPNYGSPQDAAAVALIAKLFPERRTVGRSAKAILSGGGAFHCITQQQPTAAQETL